MDDLDHGARCAAHVGEVFPPRCSDCDAAAVEAAAETARQMTVSRPAPIWPEPLPEDDGEG